MATRKKKDAEGAEQATTPKSLAAALSQKVRWTGFSFWLVGNTPLICHAWSEKAKREMLDKHTGAVKPGKERRDPQADFVNSLYEMSDGAYGFPVTGIKKCLLTAAHKDKGIPRDTVMRELHLDAEIVSVRPALAGAKCDMPLVRIYGSKPEMREDMVRVGAGLNKTSSLAYRAQFTTWAIRIRGRFNAAAFDASVLQFFAHHSGIATGIGDWRNEKNGVFGGFHVANVKEASDWDKFAKGEGKMPIVKREFEDFVFPDVVAA